jgi:hypothetical protein
MIPFPERSTAPGAGTCYEQNGIIVGIGACVYDW